jgi:hypothetical protein
MAGPSPRSRGEESTRVRTGDWRRVRPARAGGPPARVDRAASALCAADAQDQAHLAVALLVVAQAADLILLALQKPPKVLQRGPSPSSAPVVSRADAPAGPTPSRSCARSGRTTGRPRRPPAGRRCRSSSTQASGDGLRPQVDVRGAMRHVPPGRWVLTAAGPAQDKTAPEQHGDSSRRAQRTG